MKAYYIIDGSGKQSGPFPGENLRQHGITPQTYVWCEGMGDNWKKACEVAELAVLFAPQPQSNTTQPIGQEPPQHQSTRPPRVRIPNGSLSNHRPSSREPHGASNSPAHSSPAHGLSNRNSQEPGSHNSPEHGNSPSSPSSPSNPSNRQHGSSSGLECLPDGNSLSQECRASKDL